MSELPEGWINIPLKDVLKSFQSGFASGEKDVQGGLKHLRMNNIGVDGKLNLNLIRSVPASLASERHYLNKGDILFCTTNSAKLVGKCALFNLDGQFAFSNHLTKLTTNDAIHPQLLLHYLWLLWKQGEFDDKCKHWVNQSTLPKEKLLETEVLLPPLNEQCRIVAKLEKLLSRVDTAQARLSTIPSILKRFRQSVLTAACSGRLTVDWRKRDEVSAELPSGWSSSSLRLLVRTLDQGWSPRCELEPSPSPKIWGVIKTTAVQQLEFLEGENKRLPEHLKPRPDLELRGGDLLITRAGPRARAGVCCLVLSVRPRLMICDKVYRFRVDERTIMPQFLVLALNTPAMTEHIDTLKTGISDSGVNLTQEKFLDLSIALPPVTEQQEIVRRVEALFRTADALEARYLKAKEHVDKLAQSILNKAFKGELMPTEAELARHEGRDYEPASALLERIRQERSQPQTTAKPTRKLTPKPIRRTGKKKDNSTGSLF